jgi:hypothetical protein
VLLQIISRIAISGAVRNPFDCAAPHGVPVPAKGLRTGAMIEMVTAFFGFVSASIFLAHAYEGYRSRPVLQKIPKALINSVQHRTRQVHHAKQ